MVPDTFLFDRLYGGIGNDTINGDDSSTAVSGNDYLDGGDGDDPWIRKGALTWALTASLAW